MKYQKMFEEVCKEIDENIHKSNYSYYPEVYVRETLKKAINMVDDVDLELMFTDVKDKQGVKDVLSDEIMEIIRIWWEQQSLKLKKELSR